MVPNVYHKWLTDAIYETDLVKAHEIGLTLSHTLSCAVVHFGDVPADCRARVVRHDQTILNEIPSEVTPNDPAIQAHVRASVDRLLDQDQQQRMLDLLTSCVNFVLYNLKTKMS